MIAASINFQQGAKRNLKTVEAKDKQGYKGKNLSQNSSKGNSNNNKAKEKGVFKGKNKLTPKELERYRKENKCFKCGEQGHSYRSFPQRNTRNEQPRAPMVEAPKEDVHCKGSPLSYAWGKVREHDAFILFDPGSTHNFISLELAAKLGVQDFEMGDARKVDGAFIGQDVYVVTPLIGKLRLHIQGYVEKEDFFISPLKHEDVILGAPRFDCLAASIKFPERKISFKFRKKDMYINAQESGNTIPLVNDQAFDKSIKSSIFAYDLTNKNVKYVWIEKRQQAFDTLKQKLISQPVLALSDISKPFEVQCDACGDCLGAGLLQEGHAIAYESRRLSSDDQIMGIYEKELLAVLHALDSWKRYLLGTLFILQTDHQSLKYFMMQTKLFNKQMRWTNFLSRFNFYIAHIAGKHNQVADALSRRPKVNAISLATLNDLSSMIDEYAIDPNFKDVISAIALGKKEEPFTLQDGYLLHGNRLCITHSLHEKACVKRIEGDTIGHKHCTGQYFDYWACIDKHVSGDFMVAFGAHFFTLHM
ncbi:hypothetical protein L7F22_010576 [Adiantum nelumboides]|nr:hypothetical protein [Adiantum nelumboides]